MKLLRVEDADCGRFDVGVDGGADGIHKDVRKVWSSLTRVEAPQAAKLDIRGVDAYLPPQATSRLAGASVPDAFARSVLGEKFDPSCEYKFATKEPPAPCGRLTLGGYPCEVVGPHPATGCRVFPQFTSPWIDMKTGERSRTGYRVYAGRGSSEVAPRYCRCSSCRPAPEPWAPSVDEWDLLGRDVP